MPRMACGACEARAEEAGAPYSIEDGNVYLPLGLVYRIVDIDGMPRLRVVNGGDYTPSQDDENAVPSRRTLICTSDTCRSTVLKALGLRTYKVPFRVVRVPTQEHEEGRHWRIDQITYTGEVACRELWLRYIADRRRVLDKELQIRRIAVFADLVRDLEEPASILGYPAVLNEGQRQVS